MTHHSFTPVEAAFAQSQAIEQDPNLATAEGRVMREVQATLGAIAIGEHPNTVLGGLIMNSRFQHPAVGEGNGRSLGEICGTGHTDPRTTDNIFKTTQILEDLIHVGLVEYDQPPKNTAKGLLLRDDYVGTGPTYRLALPKELVIDRLVP